MFCNGAWCPPFLPSFPAVVGSPHEAACALHPYLPTPPNTCPPFNLSARSAAQERLRRHEFFRDCLAPKQGRVKLGAQVMLLKVRGQGAGVVIWDGVPEELQPPGTGVSMRSSVDAGQALGNATGAGGSSSSSNSAALTQAWAKIPPPPGGRHFGRV